MGEQRGGDQQTEERRPGLPRRTTRLGSQVGKGKKKLTTGGSPDPDSSRQCDDAERSRLDAGWTQAGERRPVTNKTPPCTLHRLRALRLVSAKWRTKPKTKEPKKQKHRLADAARLPSPHLHR